MPTSAPRYQVVPTTTKWELRDCGVCVCVCVCVCVTEKLSIRPCYVCLGAPWAPGASQSQNGSMFQPV